jgi:hypothetical protein
VIDVGHLEGGPADGHEHPGLHRIEHFVAMLDGRPWLNPPEQAGPISPEDIDRLHRARGLWSVYRRTNPGGRDADATWQYDRPVP